MYGNVADFCECFFNPYNLVMEYLWLALMWCAWCAIHSGTISMTATDFFKRKLGSAYRFFRLFFNVTAVATLIPVIIYAESIRGGIIFDSIGLLRVIQMVFLAAGIALFIAGIMHYDPLQFFGMRQIMSGSSHGTLTEHGGIDASGMLGVTRHPWYLGALFLVWSNWMKAYDVSSVLSIAILSAYLVIGTILEEGKLITELGDEYRKYQKSVSMLFPIKYLSSKIR
ncbi:methyltransferase family protein [Elusimicrobiota bacterium]